MDLYGTVPYVPSLDAVVNLDVGDTYSEQKYYRALWVLLLVVPTPDPANTAPYFWYATTMKTKMTLLINMMSTILLSPQALDMKKLTWKNDNNADKIIQSGLGDPSPPPMLYTSNGRGCLSRTMQRRRTTTVKMADTAEGAMGWS